VAIVEDRKRLPSSRSPRVVIIGAGFGGLYAARAFRDASVDLTVIDRTNHHVFQPLLYQVATATLAPTDICAPIRWLLRKQRNTEVLLAEAELVDPARHVVRCDDGMELNYDYLIIAAGARHSYFGHPEWESIAPGLKSAEDALELRRRWLTAFERAERLVDIDGWEDEARANLTFVIVGGGPTGVELAGMLPTIARHALPPDFRHIDPASARIVLVEGGPRLLPTFPEDLSTRAKTDLESLGVDVRLNQRVVNVSDKGVDIGGEPSEHIEARTILWAAGNTASPLGRSLGVPLDRSGRVFVNDDLSVPGHPEIFVVGDLAVLMTDGKPVPGVAPAAIQSGKAAAKNVLRSIRGEGRGPFRYFNKGDLATIGRWRAVAVMGGRHLTGALAWWAWLLIHIMYLAGFRNRISVLIEWGYSFFTYQRGARLITADLPRRDPPPAKAQPRA
jgi:NADH:quinone reductase (non-electrogenic)